MSILDSLRRFSRPLDRRAVDLLASCGFEGGELELLRRCGRLRRFAPGEMLTRIGSHDRALTLVLDGSVRATLADGASSLLSAVPGGCEILGELSVFGDRPYQVADVVAVTDVVALVLPGSVRSKLESAAPTLMEKVELARSPRRAGLDEAQRASREKSYQGYLAFQQALERTRNAPST